MYKTITLNAAKAKRSFSCKYSFSGFAIKQINLPFLASFPPYEWLKYLDDVTLTIYYTTNKGVIHTDPYVLKAYLGANTTLPIIPFNIFAPSVNENNFGTLTDWSNNVIFELKYRNNTNAHIEIVFQEFSEINEITN